MMAAQIAERKMLLAEGKDDRLFFEAVLKHLKLQGVQVKDLAGKQKLRSSLDALVSTSGFRRVTTLGVARDANGDAEAAFRSVCGALAGAGLPAPDRPLVQVRGHPNVAVMILPGGGAAGMLEDLCIQSVAADPAMACVEDYFRCLADNGIAPPKSPSKAKVQVFLASRERAGLPLGIAAEKGYWPFGEPAFAEIAGFLRQIAC